MLRTVKGHYKDGRIDLYEKPLLKESDVIITFLNSEVTGAIDLQARGITKEMAQDLRNRLRSSEDDWNAEGMELYDKI
ncbi:MAG TPA: hypothetical protein DHV16_12315 [Nitrospiraceae bacterium]|nr:MAG: hypothetical protein A2Z82_07455 [Nitrospirae bacterium GWA2_46_11]OGW24957.1 MAG: hypothetical protein A2X55_08405 [Nitrospirae bacterium GWB2_47_37]HAK88219.1 hypothetical protein [Nitrospiraceae bacterium]HCZ12988.1 hypothetical protein [Nitrospiraceae bacterium]